MCDIAVDTHCPTIKFASECCVTERFIDAFSVLESIHGQYKTKEICDIAVSLYRVLIVYYSDKYITQKMCDEAVDDRKFK